MQRPRPEPATYDVVIPIETNRGRGETRRIGPTCVSFATTAYFTAGDALRFAMSLRGQSGALDVFCSGSVRAVAPEGELFVVEATIENTQIRLPEREEQP